MQRQRNGKRRAGLINSGRVRTLTLFALVLAVAACARIGDIHGGPPRHAARLDAPLKHFNPKQIPKPTTTAAPEAEGFFRIRGFASLSADDFLPNEWKSSYIFSRAVDNVGTEGYHQAAGFQSSKGGPYHGIEAKHTVYLGTQVPLPLPTGIRYAEQILYAPTTKVPNGCLEVGTRYRTQNDGPTLAELYAFDFCKVQATCDSGGKECDTEHGFTQRMTVDAAFLDRFTEQAGDGTRSYALRIYTDDPLSASSRWYAQIWDVRIGDWAPFGFATGVAKRNDFWSIFEPWYTPGQCPKKLPIFKMREMQVLDANNHWVAVSGKLPEAALTAVTGTSQKGCFIGDDSGRASYAFSVDRPDDAWSVISSGS